MRKSSLPVDGESRLIPPTPTPVVLLRNWHGSLAGESGTVVSRKGQARLTLPGAPGLVIFDADIDSLFRWA